VTAVLVVERHGRVAHLQLNRPQVLNAIDAAVCESLQAEIGRLEADPGIGAIVLSGAGEKAFCAGADVKHMRTLEAGAPLRRFIELTWMAFEQLASSPLPSIAALHGHVLGGGLELALACDMRIADATVQIGLPEMGLGSVPGSGALQRLPALVGVPKATEMIITGHRMDAAAAQASGLVNRAVPAGRALATALEWAALAAQRPPEALRYMKVALRTDGKAGVAAALHGLISDACHADKRYQANTERFRAADSRGSGRP
jgi:enoyl-CoA hydratase/carnithine racemase